MVNNVAIKIIIISFVLFLIISAFFVGKWRGESIIRKMPYLKLKVPIELQESPGNIGSIPAGSAIYRYRTLPEITTYIVFVNLQERDIFEEQIKKDKFILSPIAGYPVE